MTEQMPDHPTQNNPQTQNRQIPDENAGVTTIPVLDSEGKPRRVRGQTRGHGGDMNDKNTVLTLEDHPEGKPGVLLTGKYRLMAVLIKHPDGTLEAASFHQVGQPETTAEEYDALEQAVKAWGADRPRPRTT